MISLMLALAMYIVAAETGIGWLLIPAFPLQIQGMYQLWKMTPDGGAPPKVKRSPTHRARQPKTPAHRVK